ALAVENEIQTTKRVLAFMTETPCSVSPSFWHQGKRPHRAAGGYAVGHDAVGDAAASPGQNRHVLPALVRVGDGRRVDRRAGLELPQRLAAVLIERDDLAGQQAREQEAAVGREHARRAR